MHSYLLTGAIGIGIGIGPKPLPRDVYSITVTNTALAATDIRLLFELAMAI